MKNRVLLAVTVTAMLSLTLILAPQAAMAKRWTVTQRIEKLSAEIDEGRKSNELTVKQVETLKKSVADIKEKMDKMKAKNGDKLSVPDTKKLHDDMTDLSVKTLRMRLDNVYSD